MSASAKNSARRLACFLDTIGLAPELTGCGYKENYQVLLSQYSALPQLTRREARRRGRRIIREVGLEAAAANLFPATPLQLANLLSQSPGRCPSCKSWGQRTKRSWPSREVAEAFRLLIQDLSLNVYECAAHPGSFHLGHPKRPA